MSAMGNNMANSWINAAAKLPFHLDLACPDGYDPDAVIMKRGMAEVSAGVVLHREPAESRLHVQKAVMEILMQ